MSRRLLGIEDPVLTGFFVWVVLLLAGCATPQVSSLQARWPADLPLKIELNQVPFFAQEDYECGPSTASRARSTRRSSR